MVLGYGNTIRRDDGVGPKVADAIAALALAGVRTLACALLTPELADPISQVKAVIFVDAAVDAPREVQLRQMVPAGSPSSVRMRRSPVTWRRSLPNTAQGAAWNTNFAPS